MNPDREKLAITAFALVAVILMVLFFKIMELENRVDFLEDVAEINLRLIQNLAGIGS